CAARPPRLAGPGPTGAMSLDPPTVNLPSAGCSPPPCTTSVPPPSCWARHAPPGPMPCVLTWSKTAVAVVGPFITPLLPKRCWLVTRAYGGELTKGPACTAGDSPARPTVPTLVQVLPLADS